MYRNAKEGKEMKKWSAALSLCLSVLVMTGCASLNYNEIAPNAKTFKPKIAVVLPTIKMPEGADQEGDKVIKAIYDAAVATKRFERVIDPMQAKFQMVENGQLQDALMSYTAKLRTLGVSDPESSKRIGEILQADTMIVGEVGKWGYASYRGDKTGEVAMAIKMIDAATGSAYWKAAHAAQKTYSLFKPDLPDMAADLARKIFGFMPKP
jgi:PBP1b-binding outer membrane lipoprotein LpoB